MRHLIFTKKTRPALPRLFIFNYEESSKHFVTKERKEKMKKDDTDLLKYFRYINNCIDDKRTGMMLDGKSVICRYIFFFKYSTSRKINPSIFRNCCCWLKIEQNFSTRFDYFESCNELSV